MRYFGKSWSLSNHKMGNGSKQVGLGVWWNPSRIGFQINAGIREIHLMRERKSK